MAADTQPSGYQQPGRVFHTHGGDMLALIVVIAIGVYVFRKSA